jgi:hypothetical protein
MKISQLLAIPLLTAIAGITAFGFASPTKAQYLGDAHCTATVVAEPDSRVNVRSGPGTNFEVLWWSLFDGQRPRILNDRPNAFGASPLRELGLVQLVAVLVVPVVATLARSIPNFWARWMSTLVQAMAIR